MSVGKKIKKLRNIIGVTQEEIAEGICTKNLISQIENNRKKLTSNLAVGLAKNFNKIAKEKRIDINLITGDELIKDEDGQANNIFFLNIISELKETKEIDKLEEKLNEGERLIKKYNIEDSMKIHMYKLAANIYYFKHKYNRSDEMCRNGLKVCLNSGNTLDEASFYINKSRNNAMRLNYAAALEQLNFALKLNNDIGNNEVSRRIYFNKALIYKKIKKINEALKYLQILMDQFENEDQKKVLDLKMLYANCLIEQNNFDEAEHEYIEILDSAMKDNDKNLIAMAYRNLSELYLNKKKYKDAARSIKESVKINPNNSHFAENLYFAAKVIRYINEDTERYLRRALNIYNKNNGENVDLVEKIIYELVLIYIEREDEEKLILMADKAKVLNIDYSLIYAEIGEYYRGRNEEKSIYFSKKSREKIKQIKET
ncbi:helix-turn-helix domain-containing protein [Clostridium sp. HBUAS56017]|uniref:helix-turn-helix domain-containing protein n=1 Tax=Clostridium sp. HBUAS56017 TaxID=2571128 RepID=UPI001FAB10B8|nr:helix-turn-helix domain-containing protein [Clostridium sp. HBUAS56017]